MIIVHTSDLHLGSPLTARLTGEKLKARRKELTESFINSVEEAALRSARLFIIAGDLFDSKGVSRKMKEEILSVIRRERDIDFLYLPGNHEGDVLLDGSVDLPDNLKVFGEEWTYYNYGFVTVAGKSRIDRDLFDTLRLDPDRKNIVVLHGQLADRCAIDTIGLKDARERGIDYLALGHYHSFSKRPIDTRGIAVYSGTPEGRGFDEATECGIAIIDTDGTSLDVKLLPTAKRQHIIKTVDITDLNDRIEVDSAVREALKGISATSLVRIVLTGKHTPELYADPEGLEERYSGDFYYLEVIDESGILINPEDYRYDKTLKGEFIRLVLSKDDLEPEERDRIIRAGIGALLGEIDEF